MSYSLIKEFVDLKKVHVFWFNQGKDVLSNLLAAKAVQSAALTLESIDDVHGSDCLPLCVFCVGDGIPDDVLEEHLEDTTGLLVDEARDTLDTTSSSKTTDSGLGDSLDIITKNFAMSLGTAFSQSLSPFTATSHDEVVDCLSVNDEINTLSVQTRVIPESRRTCRQLACLTR